SSDANVAAHRGRCYVPLLKARKGEVYAAVYRSEGSSVKGLGLNCLIPPQVVEMNAEAKALAEFFEPWDDVYVGGDAAEAVYAAVYPLVNGKGTGSQRRVVLAPPDHRLCDPASVGRLGERQLCEGRTLDPASLEPVYLHETFSMTNSQTLTS